MADEAREDIGTLLAERARAIRAELAGLTEAPEDFGVIQFGKRAGDATNVAAEQLSRVGAHEQLLAAARGHRTRAGEAGRGDVRSL